MKKDEVVSSEAPISVANRVLSAFVDALGEDDEQKDVAARLRKTMLEDGNLSELSLRNALFGADGI